MSDSRPVLAKLNLVASRYEETLEFYRALGLDIPPPKDQPPGTLHTEAKDNAGVEFAIDNEALAKLYNSNRRLRKTGTSVLMTVTYPSREAVDEAHARLVTAGHESHQKPFDAFWGARFAIVVDPEGNDVGLMSPVSVTHQSWPPTEAPGT